MSKPTKIAHLLHQYINDTIAKDELTEWHQYLQDDGQQSFVDDALHDYFTAVPYTTHENSKAVGDLAWEGITRQLDGSTPVKKLSLFHPFKIVAAAAAVLIILLASVYFYTLNRSHTTAIVQIHDIQPGTHKATLQAANGKIYKLAGDKEEIIAGKKAIRYKDGALLEIEDGIQNFVLNTPKGGQYRITLSDGTKVWLNAASSLSYPNEFTGRERRVTVQGEAYFEVAHNARKPFIVSTGEQEIKVLGTAFDVNAYPNEGKTVTTLVNGRVQLNHLNTAKPAYLHPGDQSVLDQHIFRINAVDVSLYTAWKEGEFRFKATPLTVALRQIERWYDLDIDYSGIPEDIQIHASIQRDKPLSAVLTALEKVTDLKFNLKGRSLKLMK